MFLKMFSIDCLVICQINPLQFPGLLTETHVQLLESEGKGMQFAAERTPCPTEVLVLINLLAAVFKSNFSHIQRHV